MGIGAEFTVAGKAYRATFERGITRARREIVAVAYDESGQAVAVQDMNTVAARGYLHRDTQDDPPTWEELENIAVDLLRARLEE